jgi:hypothetical protein
MLNERPGGLRCLFIGQNDNDTVKLFIGVPTIQITREHNSDDIATFCAKDVQKITQKFGFSTPEAAQIATKMDHGVGTCLASSTSIVQELALLFGHRGDAGLR